MHQNTENELYDFELDFKYRSRLRTMSVSSIEPILNESPKNLNRTESFDDMVIQEGRIKNVKEELVFLKRGAIIAFISIVVSFFLNVYPITSLHHLKLNVDSIDAEIKETKQKLNDDIKARSDLQLFCKNANNKANMASSSTEALDIKLEKFKVDSNARFNTADERIYDLTDVKTQVKINTLKHNNLENRLEKLLLTGILKSSNAEYNSVTSSSNLTENEERITSDLTKSLNNTLFARINELNIELQDIREKIQQNSNQLHNLSKNSRNDIIRSSFNIPLENYTSNRKSNSSIGNSEMYTIVEDIKDSLNKLRFGRRCKNRCT